MFIKRAGKKFSKWKILGYHEFLAQNRCLIFTTRLSTSNFPKKIDLKKKPNKDNESFIDKEEYPESDKVKQVMNRKSLDGTLMDSSFYLTILFCT